MKECSFLQNLLYIVWWKFVHSWRKTLGKQYEYDMLKDNKENIIIYKTELKKRGFVIMEKAFEELQIEDDFMFTLLWEIRSFANLF